MKIKFKSILSSFENIFKRTKKNKDYLKHKNIFLIIVGGIFLGLVAAISLAVCFADFNLNFKNKTTIELPIKEELDGEALDTIQKIASNNLKTKCIAQSSEIYEESKKTQQVKTLLITSYNKDIKNDPQAQENVKNMLNDIKKEFPENINIKYKEEVLTSSIEASNVEDFVNWKSLVIVAIVLVVVLLYFVIAFRKINGFLAALSYFLALLFNLSLIVAASIAVFLMLNLTLNIPMLLPIVAVCAVMAVNLTFNTSIVFKKLKDNIEKKDKEQSTALAVNQALNSENKNITTNFIIFTVLPFVSLLAIAIINTIMQGVFQSLVFNLLVLAIFLISGICIYFSSIFFLTPFWETLKKKKT